MPEVYIIIGFLRDKQAIAMVLVNISKGKIIIIITYFIFFYHVVAILLDTLQKMSCGKYFL